MSSNPEIETEFSPFRAIRGEAETMKAARQRLQRLTKSAPPDFEFKISTLLDVVARERRRTAKTPEAALRAARTKVPAECILSEDIELALLERTLSVEAFDSRVALATARSQWQDIPADLLGKTARVSLTEAGRRGFLGIGRRPHVFTVTFPAYARAFVRIGGLVRLEARPFPKNVDGWLLVLRSLVVQAVPRKAEEMRRAGKDEERRQDGPNDLVWRLWRDPSELSRRLPTGAGAWEVLGIAAGGIVVVDNTPPWECRREIARIAESEWSDYSYTHATDAF